MVEYRSRRHTPRQYSLRRLHNPSRALPLRASRCCGGRLRGSRSHQGRGSMLYCRYGYICDRCSSWHRARWRSHRDIRKDRSAPRAGTRRVRSWTLRSGSMPNRRGRYSDRQDHRRSDRLVGLPSMHSTQFDIRREPRKAPGSLPRPVSLACTPPRHIPGSRSRIQRDSSPKA